MNLDYSPEDEAFRQQVRSFIDASYTDELKQKASQSKNGYLDKEGILAWHHALYAKGWVAPNWAVEYGGPGWSPAQRFIFDSEMAAAGAPVLSPMGLKMVGPVIMAFGTDEQKKQHLPKILAGEVWWCQGYSEPGAGSDLAGLQTRAIEDGDDYVINGQKVWTSYANYADWIFCLVRTDTSTKHEGISFILFDMETEGVTTKPIKLISGSSPFCETFFDDVRVPKSQMVGRLNGGWEIAKKLLQHERTNISSGGFGASASAGLEQLVKDHVGEEGGRIADPLMRDRVAKQKMTEHAFSLTVRRATEEAKAGGEVGAASSIFKYVGAEMNKSRYELLVEALGDQGLGWEGDGFNSDELNVTRQWLRSKANSIEGGTTEINLNVVAKRVLGLRDHQ